MGYTDLLSFYNESFPKGTPYTTGFTLSSVKTGESFGAFTSETFFVKSITLFVESGATFTNFRLRYPNLHTSGVFDETRTGYDGLRYFCGASQKLPDGQGNEYYTGKTYYKFDIDFQKPIHLVNADGDYIHIGLQGLANGEVDVQANGWRVLTTDDGV
nr:MAG: hypothetical protein [Lokiarchaeota virus Ratatoskr Meg22_1012]